MTQKLLLSLITLPLHGGEVELPSPTSESAFIPFASLTGEGFYNLNGGIETGHSYQSLLEFGFDYDLEKALGWSGATFHASGLWLAGDETITDDYVGDFGGVSNIVGLERIRLYRFYLQQELWDGAFTFKLGQLALDDDFMSSDNAALFINANFGPLPTESGNIGSPIYPLGALGAWFQYSPDENTSFQFGIYDGDAGTEGVNDQGFNTDLGADQGLALMIEAGKTIDNTTYKLGGYLHTGDFERFSDGATLSGTHSFYAQIDHALTPSLNTFLRAGFSPNDDRDAVQWYFDTGLVGQGFRENDLWGLGLTYTKFSDDFIATLSTDSDSETVIELTYQAQLCEHFIVQPDLQYIIDPQNAPDEDAFVAGLRVIASF